MDFKKFTCTETRNGRNFEFRLTEGSLECVEEVWEIVPGRLASQRMSQSFKSQSLGDASRAEYCRVTLASWLDAMQRQGAL